MRTSILNSLAIQKQHRKQMILKKIRNYTSEIFFIMIVVLMFVILISTM